MGHMLLNFDDKLHKKLKIKAANENRTMKEIIFEAVEKAVQK